MAPISIDDLPPEIRGPSAWYGPDLAARGDWIEQLIETEILEIDAAAERLANAEFDIPSVRKHNFPLPMLGPRLRRMLEHVLTGRGFVLLRRLPVERWSKRKTATAYFGLGSHLGSARSQNAQGHVLGHVKDLGFSSSDPNVRIYQRKYIDSARRFVKTPLTSQQQEALDLFDALADDPALNLPMELLSGDVQLVHNHTLLHDRTAFEDWPEPGRKRHLLRLWLAPPEARPLPPVFAERYGGLVPGDRGGVSVEGAGQTAPLA